MLHITVARMLVGLIVGTAGRHDSSISAAMMSCYKRDMAPSVP